VDDGCGMNANIIRDKLLVLGGSQKKEGSVGGFGKAKEILFFAWSQWSIKSSQDGTTLYEINNEMIGKEPIRCIETECKIGTEISINLYEEGSIYDAGFWKYKVEHFLSFLSTEATICLDGEEVKCEKVKGTLKSSELADFIVDKDFESSKMVVRLRGIPMFWRMMPNLESTVYVELKGESVNFLAANRDNLVYPFRSKLDEKINEMIVDPRSATEKKPQMVIDTFAGLNVMDKLNEFHHPEVTDHKKDFIEAIIAQNTTSGITNYKAVEEQVSDTFPELGQLVSDMLEGSKHEIGPMGYEFMVERREDTKNYPMKIDSKKLQTILHYWTNIILKIEEEFNQNVEIGVGFTFDKECNAKVFRKYSKRVFLINPNAVESTKGKIATGIEIFMLAAHEYTHCWYSEHNELFASREGLVLRLMGRQWNDWNNLFIRSKNEVLEAFNNR
jgi:hypothetical protein